MNSTQLRFTLINDTLGSLVVNDPEGYDTIPLTLEREKDFSDVFEKFTSPLTFNQNAITYLEAAEALGLDTKVVCKVEISEDYGVTWEGFFPEGLIDFETKLRLDEAGREYKLQYNIKQNDLWSAFYNRKSTVVNVGSTTDLDGNTVAPVPTILPVLPSQVLDRVTRVETILFSDSSYVPLIWDITATNIYGAIDLPSDISNEVLTKFNLPPVAIPDFPVSLINIDENGTYDFDISFTFADSDVGPTEGPSILYFFVKAKIAGTIYTFTRTDHGTFLTNQTTQFTFSASGISLKAGQQVFIYLQWTNPGLVGTLSVYMVARGIRPGWESYINIVGHTIGNLVNAPVILTYDVADAVIKRIAPTSLYSPFFGGASQGYGSNGCGYTYANAQGLQWRNFTLADKPLALSFDDWWAGANPIFNLGLGTEKVGGVEKIYIDEKSKFFDASGTSVKLSNVSKVSRTRKFDKVYKSVKIGYDKWEKTGGGTAVDDPQASHEYASPFRLVGQVISIMSKWIAAGLLIELTRRASVKPGQTFDTDNDVFVIKLNSSLSGPDLTGTASNLSNAASRYNKELTPARNFLRWLNVFNVGQKIGGVFKFISGVGNFTASINISPGGCADDFMGSLAENSDIIITSDVLHGTETEDFEAPFSWSQYKALIAAKRKRMEVSETDTGHELYYIEKFNFYLFQGKAKFTLTKAA